MQLRYFRYFVSLARLRHFARAAETCGVTQPTLSAGLTALEREIGWRLVERDRRFVRLTERGEALLPWAQQILGTITGMKHAVGGAGESISGDFRLACVPAALPLIGHFGEALLRSNPGVTLSVYSRPSREIVRGLNALEYDAGMTYLDGLPPELAAIPLHAERYCFVVRTGACPSEQTTIAWTDLADWRLCMLHPDMQFRQILDTHLQSRGVAVAPRMIADSFTALLGMVREGGLAAIVPEGYAGLLEGVDWAHILRFDQVEVARTIGLVLVDRTLLAPLASAGLAAARSLSPPEPTSA